MSGAVDKYIHIAVNPRFDEDSIRVSYSTTEIVKDPSTLKHPLVREALDVVGITRGIEIVSVADAPASTGLGSSGSFCVGLLRALHSYLREEKTSQFVAEEACNISMDRLKEPSGKQDEYAAAFGGIRAYTIDRDGEVKVESIPLSTHILAELEANILMYYTGITRSSSSVLSKQKTAIEKGGADVKMDKIKSIGLRSRDALASGDLTKFGQLLDEHWKVKRGVVGEMSSDQIDRWYKVAKENGATGGKLCFAPGTLVSTEEGPRPIESISPGDRVYDHRNRLQRVQDSMKRRYEGTILEFTLGGLDEKLRVTPEHPLMTTMNHPNDEGENGQGAVNLALFRPANDFREGDGLLIPAGSPVDDVEYLDSLSVPESPTYISHDLHRGLPYEAPVDDRLVSSRSEGTAPLRVMNGEMLSTPGRTYTVSIYGDDESLRSSLQSYELKQVLGRNNRGLSLRKDFLRIEGVTYAKASIGEISQVPHDGQVYNLDVANSHTYVAGGVAVHNCGAGGGGFLMLYCENGRARLRKAMTRQGLVEHRFRFDFEGSKVVYNV